MAPSKKEGLPNTIQPNTDSTQAVWSGVRKTWPGDHVLSAFACENLFASLTIENRQAAFRGIEPYLSDCRTRNRKVCDLSTYLREKRWERLPATVKAWPIRGGTPQAFRWLEYRKAAGQPVAFMTDCFASGKLWYAPTEWPPPLPAAKEADELQASLDDLVPLAKEMTGL